MLVLAWTGTAKAPAHIMRIPVKPLPDHCSSTMLHAQPCNNWLHERKMWMERISMRVLRTDSTGHQQC